MKKKDKEKRTPKKFLWGLLEVLGEIALYAVFAAVGFGLICLFTSFNFAKRTDPELMILIGIAAILALVLVCVLVVYIVRKRKK